MAAKKPLERKRLARRQRITVYDDRAYVAIPDGTPEGRVETIYFGTRIRRFLWWEFWIRKAPIVSEF